MSNIISSIFSHEIKNALSSIKFGLEMFVKYDIDKDELKKTSSELLKSINNTILILEEYINYVKFQFNKKLKYESINLNELLEEIKEELLSFAKEKGVNLYLQKSDKIIYNNRFWLKRAIYNIVYNAIKYNKQNGAVNINVENSSFGVYISIRDTGIGIDREKIKKIFKVFEQIDEKSKGFGIGLALSKAVLESVGGKISVKSNVNIGSDFILYIPTKPKDVTIKNIAKGIGVAGVLLFLGVSYFPIYTQNYKVFDNGGYISYRLEDGSILKFTKDSQYQLSIKKNLYDTKYSLSTYLEKGSVALKAIKTKADIQANGVEFTNLGTDFEVIKDDEVKVAVFDGKVFAKNSIVNKNEGLIVADGMLQKVKLLDKVKLKIKDDMLILNQPKAQKFHILISKNKDFVNIIQSFYTSKIKTTLNLNDDGLYFIKVFGIDENNLPSMPNVIKYINLKHYKIALKQKGNEALLELQNSISTINKHSPLPYYEIAKLYFKNKNYKKALFYITIAYSIKQNDNYLRLLADIYVKLHKFNKLKEIIDVLLKKYPNDIQLLYYKALIQKDTNLELAQKTLFKLLQKNPYYKPANLLMSEVLEKLGKHKLAKYYRGLVDGINK